MGHTLTSSFTTLNVSIEFRLRRRVCRDGGCCFRHWIKNLLIETFVDVTVESNFTI